MSLTILPHSGRGDTIKLLLTSRCYRPNLHLSFGSPLDNAITITPPEDSLLHSDVLCYSKLLYDMELYFLLSYYSCTIWSYNLSIYSCIFWSKGINTCKLSSVDTKGLRVWITGTNFRSREAIVESNSVICHEGIRGINGTSFDSNIVISTTEGFDDVATWTRRDVQGSSSDDWPPAVVNRMIHPPPCTDVVSTSTEETVVSRLLMS